MDTGTLIQVVKMINIMLDERHDDDKPQTNHNDWDDDDDYEEEEEQHGVDGVSIEDILFWKGHGRTSALLDVRNRLQAEIDLQIAEREKTRGN
jgi:hypothetical protein